MSLGSLFSHIGSLMEQQNRTQILGIFCKALSYVLPNVRQAIKITQLQWDKPNPSPGLHRHLEDVSRTPAFWVLPKGKKHEPSTTKAEEKNKFS